MRTTTVSTTIFPDSIPKESRKRVRGFSCCSTASKELSDTVTENLIFFEVSKTTNWHGRTDFGDAYNCDSTTAGCVLRFSSPSRA